MRPTNRFKKWFSDAPSEYVAKYATAAQEYECEICGVEPMHDWVTFISSVAHQGCGEYWRNRYDVCWQCAKAGVASFPERLRKQAEELEGRARELRRLANAKFVRERRQRRTKLRRSSRQQRSQP